jgi:hypothetical protein
MTRAALSAVVLAAGRGLRQGIRWSNPVFEVRWKVDVVVPCAKAPNGPALIVNMHMNAKSMRLFIDDGFERGIGSGGRPQGLPDIQKCVKYCAAVGFVIPEKKGRSRISFGYLVYLKRALRDIISECKPVVRK